MCESTFEITLLTTFVALVGTFMELNSKTERVSSQLILLGLIGK